jgi:hypothetical protein
VGRIPASQKPSHEGSNATERLSERPTRPSNISSRCVVPIPDPGTILRAGDSFNHVKFLFKICETYDPLPSNFPHFFKGKKRFHSGSSSSLNIPPHLSLLSPNRNPLPNSSNYLTIFPHQRFNFLLQPLFQNPPVPRSNAGGSTIYDFPARAFDPRNQCRTPR